MRNFNGKNWDLFIDFIMAINGHEWSNFVNNISYIVVLVNLSPARVIQLRLAWRSFSCKHVILSNACLGGREDGGRPRHDRASIPHNLLYSNTPPPTLGEEPDSARTAVSGIPIKVPLFSGEIELK